MPQETWTSRDLPVLVALAEYFEEEAAPGAGAYDVDLMHTVPDQGAGTMTRALIALDRGGYIDARIDPQFDGARKVYVYGLTERGRRTAGLWPPDQDELVAALERAIEEEPDEEKRTTLRRFLDAARSGTRDVVVDVLAAVIARHAGGA
jgi:DNA-binding PadR family transcriptional regulator